MQHAAITFYTFKTHTYVVTYSQSHKIWGYLSIFNTTLMGTIFLMNEKKKKTKKKGILIHSLASHHVGSV